MGLKPTRGLLSSHGIIPVSREQDVIGPISRTVKDAALVLDAITSIEKNTGYYVQSCSTTDFHGVRIGVIHDPVQQVDKAKLYAFQATLNLLRTIGAIIVEDIRLTGLEEYNNLPASLKSLVLETDFIVSIEAYLRSLAVNPRGLTTLERLIDAIKGDPNEEYPSRNIATMQRALATGVNSPSYQRILAKQAYCANAGGLEGAIK